MHTSELTPTGFGSRVNGRPDRHTAPNLTDLLHRHGVLLLPGLAPTPGEFVEFARQFGEPEHVFPEAHQVAGHAVLRLQSNVDGLGASAGGRYWHADGAFAERPTAVTALLCVEAPASGGDTLFADMRAALASLPDEVRAQAAGHRGYYPAKEIARRDMERARMMRTVVMTDEEQAAKLAELQNVHHPLVRRHPVTGKQALYLNEHWLARVEGLTDADSERLLATLYEAATRESHVYRHTWTEGDVLVWDNALVMHKALPAANGTRKVTYRCTIADGSAPPG
ncbi:TauD/TfdA dioxygenase family protein [Streptomyces sp. NPDC017529]|uniref:TauD/TfdA dioxygenase family protein n=1 Tax=Streptomyces sp. NPDC017529 TaxID=3365000 RepID=UPI0037904CDC